MKVVFSHGKESGPWGKKIKKLAETAQGRGFDVESIDYREVDSPDERARLLENNLHGTPANVVLVGSSMGGYVSVVASHGIPVRGLFLLAPALFMSNYEVNRYEPKTDHIELVHGWRDNVIPVENSIKFAQEFGCPLHILEDDHRLNGSIGVIAGLFDLFLQKLSTD